MSNNSQIPSHRLAIEPLMTDKTYGILKATAQIYLPALGTMYFGLAQIWGLPFGEQISGTILVLDTFLGVLVGISSKVYNVSDAKYAGAMDVRQEDGRKKFTFTLDKDPEDLVDKQDVTFRVNAPR